MLGLAPCLGFSLAACALTALPEEPVEIGVEPQFLIDDYIVDNRWAIRFKNEAVVRICHQPVKDERNPLIAGKGGYVYVIHDREAGLFRMWYQDFWLQSPKPNLKYTYAIAYAESKDGLDWQLPDLGLYEWKETKQNNIVWRGSDGRASSPYLLELPDEHRRGHRFVMLYKGTDGVHLIGSEDGIHWKQDSDVRIAHRFWPDTNSSVVWDPNRQEFVWYMRATNLYGDRNDRLRGGATRRVARMSSPRLWEEWPIKPQNILIPDALDTAENFNFFYGMPARYHAGIYWGFLWPFKLNTDIYTELVVSRDGIRFERFPGRPRLLDLGDEGQWDQGMVFGTPRWVEMGDEWWIYYSGHDGPHGTMDRTPGVGLARIRKEGFVSMRGPKGGGVICTRTLRWPGGRLLVNVDAAGGELKARVSDEQRKPVQGFDYDDCTPFTADSLAHDITWQEHSIEELTGKVIRLEFYLRDADLYTFRARRD